MKRVLAAVIVGVSLTASIGAIRPVHAEPESTMDMVQDLDKKIKVADEQLNEAYQKLRARLDETGQEKLKKAERAWIAFRDAQCEVEADEARGGTLEKVLRLQCMLRMTIARTAELKAVVPLSAEK